MIKNTSNAAKCDNFRHDLEILASTGKASDEYVEHLSTCQRCQKAMQKRVLNNIRAMDNAE